LRGILGNRRFWTALTVAAVLVGLMALTRKGIGRLEPLRSILNEVLAPVESAAAAVTGAGSSAEAFVRDLLTLRATNAKLRAEVAMLRGQVVQNAELRQDNVRLRGLLALRDLVDRQDPGSGGVAAQVIARNADTWFASVVVGKGADEGVRMGMVAVAPAGLVGRVTALSPHTATVTLITSPDAGVGAMVERATSRDAGVVLGQLGRTDLRMEFFVPHPSVQVGDTIVTSGLGGLYPQGLLIGSVTSVGPGDFGLVELADVRPAVDLGRLEYVLLIQPPKAGSG
jgi:rod shape-determining protein MreC